MTVKMRTTIIKGFPAIGAREYRRPGLQLEVTASFETAGYSLIRACKWLD
jgi:hypothetical protein